MNKEGSGFRVKYICNNNNLEHLARKLLRVPTRQPFVSILHAVWIVVPFGVSRLGSKLYTCLNRKKELQWRL